MVSNEMKPVTPRWDNILTAREAIEPLVDQLELRAEAQVLEAALEAGWSANEAAKALSALRLEEAHELLAHAGRFARGHGTGIF